MKILFVVEQYAAEGARYYREFFRHLRGHGASVVVVNINESNSFREDVREMVDGYHSLGLKEGYHRSIGPLRRIIKEEDPSLIQGMETIPAFYSALALRFKGSPPLVYGRRHGPTEGPKARIMDWVAFTRARRVIAVSEAMAEVAKREHPLGTRKVTWIRSGVSLGMDTELSEEERAVLAGLAGSDAPIVLLLARLRAVKGHRVALQAVQILKEEGIALRLLFAGEGEEREALEREVRERGLVDEVVFAGHLEGIRALLNLSHVMILPSFADAFPKVVVEAFAGGVPVVASSVGGLTELIDHGETGLLVEPGNPVALAASLRDLLGNPEMGERLAANARDVYSRELTPEVMVERYHVEYQTLLGDT